MLRPLQTGLVRLIGSVLQLALSLLLAHLSGSALLGRFLFFVAVVNLCTAVGAGMPNLMLRYASTASVGRTPQVGWLWRHSLELSLLCCASSAVFGLTGAPFLRDTALGVGGLLVQRMSSAVLKSTGRPNLGVLLDTAFYPVVVIASILLINRWAAPLSVEPLRLSYVAALWAETLLAVIVTWAGPGSLRTAWSAPWRTARAMYLEIGAVTLGAVANVVTSNAPLVLAPLFLSDADTGILGLGLRVAGFATTILVSLSAYFGPAFARASSAQELFDLRRRSQYACLALYLPVPIALLLLPAGWLTSIAPDLGAIKVLVLVLSVGFFVNAATGLAPTLLLMRGWARVFSTTSIATAALTVVALAAGGALAGLMGMAAGMSAVMAATNVWIFVVSTQRLREMAARPAPEVGLGLGTS